MKKKTIYILLDYLNSLYSRDKSFYGLKLDKILKYFSQNNFEPIIKKFSEIDFRNENYNNQYIIYQSSEDIGQKYKSYIEDILLGLYLQGAILIPDFKYFRAHDNKVFAEILRDISGNAKIKNIISKSFGTYEEYLNYKNTVKTPSVFKTSHGSLSSGVRLLRNEKDKVEIPYELSRTKLYKSIYKQIKEPFKPYIKSLKKLIKKNYVTIKDPRSLNREKFIIQNFVQGLANDYKILIYGEKYYFLKRINRPDDFRASGGGRISWEEKPPDEVLKFAKNIYEEFKVPFISLDIGFDGNELYLFEFQFICFGTITIARSKFYFTQKDDKWIKVDEIPDVEKETVNSIVRYIDLL